MNKRSLGNKNERKAQKYLEEQGFKILEINYYTPKGEVDIIYRDREYYVFGEVKYRKDSTMGHPIEAVDFRKQRHIVYAALYYLKSKGLGDNVNIRFDIISILGNDICLYKNAFEPMDFL